MIYLVFFSSFVIGFLAYLLSRKPKEVVTVREVEVIREVLVPGPSRSPKEWLEEEIEVRDRLLRAMESSAMRVAIEASTTTIQLETPDLKGRIIGREGRNHKAFESTTGVELIIDDAENAVTLSSFDPYRREIAAQTLKVLLKDGKVQPSRIEEVYLASQKQVENSVLQAGEQAARQIGIELPRPVLKVLGKLKYRTSFAQNVLDHSLETATLAAQIASEFALDVEVTKRAALLHDIGKALDAEGPHALTGMEFLRASGESEVVLNAVGAHHHDIEPSSSEARVLIIADTLSASRPGARKEAHDNYLQRLAKLEEIATSQPGVAKSFAIQAGRELQILLKPEAVAEDQVEALVQEIARKIKESATHHGQITITAIRETRHTAVIQV